MDKLKWSVECELDRKPINIHIELVYKGRNVNEDDLKKIVDMCVAFEKSHKDVSDLYGWGIFPEYLYQLDWAVYDLEMVCYSSISKSKHTVKQNLHLNRLVTFARKYFKMSLADTLRFLKLTQG